MIKKKLFVRSYKGGTSAKRPMVNAYNEKCFWVFNGPVLSNLKDLSRALDSMADKQYEHHVSKTKNDFADWAEFVLLDKDCAKSLRSAANRSRAASLVEKSLKHYLA